MNPLLSDSAAFLPYRGRFAPSPTGPLHFGSLVAALASCLEARKHNGFWLVRMEDVDRPRNEPGAAKTILDTLEAHGFAWDEPILRQSRRDEAYQAVLEQLLNAGLAYGCACSRSEIAAMAHRTALDGGPVYPGICRFGLPPGRQARAWRMRVDETPIAFNDALQGWQLQNLERDVGDFVLRRADGLFAYQLAVVVDDAAQGITHVVRGADLLDSTPRQIWLQRCLGLPEPTYAHLPVAVDDAGEKLSKQTRAPGLNSALAAENLFSALGFLGQNPPASLRFAQVSEVWEWALAHWRFDAVPRRNRLCASDFSLS